MNVTGSIFTGPVLIKPLGVVVPAEMIGAALGLSIQVTKKFALEEQAVLSPELYVTSQTVLKFFVTAVLPKELLELRHGAKHFNNYMLKQAKLLHGIADEPEVEEDDEEEEVKPRRRRGRPSRSETPVVEAKPVDPESLVDSRAISFAAYEVIVKGESIPIAESEPYKAIENKSDKNGDVLQHKLSIITTHLNQVNALRSKLANPSAADVTAAAGSLVPELDDELGPDRAALDGYEVNLKTKIEQNEAKVREAIDFFRNRVVGVANTSESQIRPFSGEIRVGDNVVTLDEVLKAIREEVFIPADL